MTHGDDIQKQLENQSQTAGRILKNKAKQSGKKIGKKILASLWKMIAPVLPYLLIIIFIILFGIFTIGILFSAMPQGKIFASNPHTYRVVEDDEAEGFLKELILETDYQDRWIVEGESSSLSPWHGTRSGEKTKYVSDYLGRDSKFFGRYGMIQSATILQMITYQLSEIDDKFKENTAYDFHPYVYYKPSKIVTVCKTTETDEDGNTYEVIRTNTTEIYLMVESFTVEGHYIYNYKEEIDNTEPELHTCVTAYREVPLGEGTQILPNPWQRLDNWVKSTYNLSSTQDIAFLRASVFEGGKAYTSGQENLQWLFEQSEIPQFFVSQGLVPIELQAYFTIAEQAFGVPAWFLQAIALRESSFNPEAINKTTGAWGVMQLMPHTQQTTVNRLMSNYQNIMPPELVSLFYETENKDAEFYKMITKDPLVNILAGTLHLVEDKGLKIDWDADWKQQSLPALALYGGFQYVPERLWSKYGVTNEQESKSQEKVNEWCRDVYASKIWDTAENLKSEGGWPFNGDYPITARYGAEGIWAGGHHGVDFGMSTGTPLLAVTNSKVLFAGQQGDYGNLIILTNGTFKFYYAHLSDIKVRAAEEVRKGQVIGLSGNTGRSTGPHLHFEIRKFDTNQTFNPGAWLTPRPGYSF